MGFCAPTAEYNENFFTTSAIGLISVVTVIIVPVLYLVDSQEISLILIGLGTFIATVGSTCTFAIPKLLIAYDLVNVSSQMTLRRSTLTPGGLSAITPAATSPDKPSFVGSTVSNPSPAIGKSATLGMLEEDEEEKDGIESIESGRDKGVNGVEGAEENLEAGQGRGDAAVDTPRSDMLDRP
ncbi:hypothetical protein HDV00_009069 [Rhizophlyctis rosea]|nr:hypothetical protein HDV00_009069 [Rhizophlyctis rosea]